MGVLVVAHQGTTTQSKNLAIFIYIIIILVNLIPHQSIVGQLGRTQSKNSSSAYHCHHGCDTVAASIFIVIVMITKEEMWTASMTRQGDTPSFSLGPPPSSQS